MPYLQINGKSLYHTTNGPQDAKATIVLIHGLGSSSSYYYPTIPHLPPTIKSIAIDMSGSGQSGLGSTQQTIASIVEDVAGQLDALGVTEKVTIIGHSMGGIVASQFAETHSERVNGVVLIGPVDPNDAIAKVFDARIQVVEKDGVEALASTVPVAATGSASTPLHHAFIRSLILGTPAKGYASLCSVISTAKKPNYAAITVPLLIVIGVDDKTTPRAMSEAILKGYGTAEAQKRIVALDGVGHWHCIEAGEAVARQIKDFVAEVN